MTFLSDPKMPLRATEVVYFSADVLAPLESGGLNWIILQISSIEFIFSLHLSQQKNKRDSIKGLFDEIFLYPIVTYIYDNSLQ